MITYFLQENKPNNVLESQMLMHLNDSHNFQDNVFAKENYMKKKNFGYEEHQNLFNNPIIGYKHPGVTTNGINLTENLNYVKRQYDNSKSININNHFNINNYSNYNNQSMPQKSTVSSLKT